jgi:hypothetical protein
MPEISSLRPARSFLRPVLASIAMMTAWTVAAEADDATTVVRTAKALMDSGRFVRCGLDMQPTDRGGYYRCFDFGPYRVVEDYPRLSVFVTAGGDPFRIFAAEAGRGSFLFQGPWATDLAPRLAKYAADAVADRAAGSTADIRRLEAEARLGAVIDAERPKPPPTSEPVSEAAPAPVPAPPAATRPAAGRDYPIPPVAGAPGAPVGDAELKAALEAVGMTGRR